MKNITKYITLAIVGSIFMLLAAGLGGVPRSYELDQVHTNLFATGSILSFLIGGALLSLIIFDAIKAQNMHGGSNED